MNDEFCTVATFWSPVEANLARNRLEDGGIRAYLADEETAAMNWVLTNALGGIKLQVHARDAEAAAALLGEEPDAPAPADVVGAPPESGELEPEEPEPTLRERNAERALRGAVFGLLFLPLQVYVFWLLLKVYLSDEPLSPARRRNALVAVALNLPIMLGIGFFLRAMFS